MEEESGKHYNVGHLADIHLCLALFANKPFNPEKSEHENCNSSESIILVIVPMHQLRQLDLMISLCILKLYFNYHWVERRIWVTLVVILENWFLFNLQIKVLSVILMLIRIFFGFRIESQKFEIFRKFISCFQILNVRNKTF